MSPRRKPPVWLALWLLALISVPLQVRLYAAITIVQEDADGASGNDAVITFGANTTAGNVVLLASVLGAQTDTMEVTGISETEVVIHDAADFSTMRGYLFCITVTNPDTTYIMTTSGTGGAHSIGIEVSNATCTEDGTSQANATTTTQSHALTTDITIAAGSIIWGIVRSTNGADFSAGAGVTSSPTGNAEVGGETLGGYRIEASGGTYNLPFSSSPVNETTLIMAGAVTASGGGGGGGTAMHRLLLKCCDQ